jgi:cell division protein FtsB
MADRRAAAEAAVAELEARREALAAQVAYITSERGQEAEMRRQFDIAREGEQVVIILDEIVRSE